jgi:hypothetical protein
VVAAAEWFKPIGNVSVRSLAPKLYSSRESSSGGLPEYSFGVDSSGSGADRGDPGQSAVVVEGVSA